MFFFDEQIKTNIDNIYDDFSVVAILDQSAKPLIFIKHQALIIQNSS